MDWSYRISCGSVLPVCILSREKSSQISHKYEGRVEFLHVMLFKLLPTKQLNTALKTATSSRFLSIFSSNSWWEMCSSGNRTRSVRPGGNYRPIRHTKILEIQTGIFGRMERAHKKYLSWSATFFRFSAVVGG